MVSAWASSWASRSTSGWSKNSKILEDILATQAYDEAKAEIERGEDKLIPWEQAKKEIGEERAKLGRRNAV